jgi:choline dehydrogenase-like flavoprotein
MHDKVDVLIIGSGASGAAVAWSLADTRMRILCLEQGDGSLLDPVRKQPRMYRVVE